MAVMNLSKSDQQEVLKIVAAILHLGNIEFRENGNYAQVRDQAFLAFPGQYRVSCVCTCSFSSKLP